MPLNVAAGILAGAIDRIGSGVHAFEFNPLGFTFPDTSGALRQNIINVNYFENDPTCTNPNAGSDNVFREPAGTDIKRLDQCTSSFVSRQTSQVRPRPACSTPMS